MAESGVERIAAAFAAAAGEGRAALMPYLMGGFPDMETSAAVIDAYADTGADLIELGVPYSDPLADGPVIHAAGTAALEAGTTFEGVLAPLRAGRRAPPRAADGLRQRRPHPGPRPLRREAPRRGRLRCDRARSAAGRGRRDRGRADRARPRADRVRLADHAARPPRADGRRRRRVHLRGLAGRGHRRARRASARPRRADRRGPARLRCTGRGRVRDRHAGASGRGGSSSRTG